MAQVLILSPHSFVDVITNSSSELFVAETSKTIDAVKEILVELVRIHNQKEKLRDEPHFENLDAIFGTMFLEPTRVDFTFQPHEAGPLWHAFVQIEGCRAFDHPLYQECSEKWRQARDKVTYDEVFGPWHELVDKTWDDMLVWACTKHGIEIHRNEKGQVRRDDYGSDSPLDPKLARIVHALSWGYNFKAGDVIIESAGDNSIPYWMFDDIQNVLNAWQRKHLG